VVSCQLSVASKQPPRFCETNMPRKISWLPTLLAVLCATALLLTAFDAAGQEFDRVVIDGNFPGGYQVEVADVNGDKLPDVIAVGGGTCAWYENPSWKKRVVTGPRQTPGVISSATADFDGDGKVEIAIAFEFSMNEPKKGKLLLAVQASTLDDPWTLIPIADIGSIHRLRWGDVDADKRPDLVVASIFGPEAKPPQYVDGAPLGVFRKFDWRGNIIPKIEKITSRPVMHAIDVVDLFKNGQSCLLTADDLGTALVRWVKHSSVELIDGWQAPLSLTVADPDGAPSKRGASEVHAGRMADGQCLLATIEPWHGNRVAVYLAAILKSADGYASLGPFGGRTVLDDSLADGHALWVADVDRDGDDEVVAGHRGKDHRVSMYDFDRSMNKWQRTVLDREIAAQDLRGGDLDGDGTPDIVAVGGSTHNVVWYRPKKR
jgi:FG-GAP-like repeat